MKKFDLKQAKAGAPVCMRDGRPVRIICFDRKGFDFPIVALYKDNEHEDHEVIEEYTADGYFFDDGEESEYDLMMAPIKHEGWINIYSGRDYKFATEVYLTEEKAFAEANSSNYITTIKIEWNE